jgi:hypothetical protein
MSSLTKFVLAVVTLMVMIVVTTRQLFLFTFFREPQGFVDSQGSNYHLWLAFTAGITACIAGALMIRFFLQYENKKWVRIPPVPLTAGVQSRRPNLMIPAAFDPKSWALANPWLTEGQPDDRIPMDGSVSDNGLTPSAQRAFARRSHQLRFKKWSQARHD